jgi:large subunit ribosomal protein L19
MDLIKYVDDKLAGKKDITPFKPGYTITVHYKIKEGDKERIQQFQGVVIQRKGFGNSATFTVRKISNGIGVERIFPVNSPFIDKIVVNKEGVVRRAKIYYIRKARGKKGRIEEKHQGIEVNPLLPQKNPALENSTSAQPETAISEKSE